VFSGGAAPASDNPRLTGIAEGAGAGVAFFATTRPAGSVADGGTPVRSEVPGREKR